jgi:hypothetical protein
MSVLACWLSSPHPSSSALSSRSLALKSIAPPSMSQNPAASPPPPPPPMPPVSPLAAARIVEMVSLLADAKSSLGDTKSSLSDV